jgi:uncharacterized membrane protein
MYKYLLYFLIFSFLGWCAEVSFHAVKYKSLVNRGLARGPVCPIYGVGICLSYALLGSVDSFLLLALLSMAIATAVELAVGFFTDRALSLRLWDYTAERGNILGYVCPRFSVVWGIVTAAILRLLPLLSALIDALDTPVLRGVSFLLFILIVLDLKRSMIRAVKKQIPRRRIA